MQEDFLGPSRAGLDLCIPATSWFTAGGPCLIQPLGHHMHMTLIFVMIYGTIFLEDKDGLILVHWYYIVSRVVAVYRYAGYVMCVLNLRYRDQDLFGLFQIMDH